MNRLLDICELCTNIFGQTMGLVLLFIFSPVIISIGILLFLIAIPIGLIYKIVRKS